MERGSLAGQSSADGLRWKEADTPIHWHSVAHRARLATAPWILEHNGGHPKSDPVAFSNPCTAPPLETGDPWSELPLLMPTCLPTLPSVQPAPRAPMTGSWPTPLGTWAGPSASPPLGLGSKVSVGAERVPGAEATHGSSTGPRGNTRWGQTTLPIHSDERYRK